MVSPFNWKTRIIAFDVYLLCLTLFYLSCWKTAVISIFRLHPFFYRIFTHVRVPWNSERLYLSTIVLVDITNQSIFWLFSDYLLCACCWYYFLNILFDSISAHNECNNSALTYVIDRVLVKSTPGYRIEVFYLLSRFICNFV